jgi:uncharacterized protein
MGHPSAARPALELDRLSPRVRPRGLPSGHQRWRDLLFVHFAYPADEVRRLVPAELELDLWDGMAWVGIVPFAMGAVRLRLQPRALGLSFLETNLRTYVHHRGKPGVYFFSLEASSLLAVKAARWGWGLPYHHASMRMTEADGTLAYATTRRSDPRARCSARCRPGEVLGACVPGTFEFFLLERYCLFSVRRGRVLKGHVHHVPYPAQRVELLELSEGLTEAAGLRPPGRPPEVAHFSRGVDVEVFGPVRVDA